jgi:ubiquitin C-terminal hydrolase
MNKCRGIINNGNDCYLNSALQCLAASPFILSFINEYMANDLTIINTIKKYNLIKYRVNQINSEADKLIKEKDSLNIPEKDIEILEYISKNSYVLFIYLVFKEMILNLNNNNPQVLRNTQFMEINKEIANYFNFEELFNGEQNDPHEVIVYLLDKIHDAKKISINIDIQSNNTEELDDYTKLYLNNYKKIYENNYSLFVKNFYYQILSCIQCNKCNTITNNVSPSDILCISIPDNLINKRHTFLEKSLPIKEVSIYDCLNNMFKIESIDYKCEKCDNIKNNKIEKKIMNRPKTTLIMKIKKYYNIDDKMIKNNQPIRFPELLDIQSYIIGNESSKYELYAIINHVGCISSGHYYSYVKKYNTKTNTFFNQWFCCNDSNISTITKEEALNTNNAFMLFYHYIDN